MAVSIKFIIELVVIIVALAFVLYWFFTNYSSVSTQFWGWLATTPFYFKPNTGG